jgi:peptidoglycan/LPS O-acetylase OafA/YrhL
VKTRLLPQGYFNISGEAGYFPALDGLRAIAIIMVLLRHWAVACREHFNVYLPLGNHLLSNICLNGWSGVDLFFALSGFLVGGHVLRQARARFERGFVRRYYLQRALRIGPLYILILALCVLGQIPYYPAGGMDAFQFLVQLLFLQDYLGSPILLPLWSLGVEEKFYLMAPFLAFYLLKFKQSRTVHMLLVFSAVPALGALLVLQRWQPESYGDFFWTLRTPFHFAVAAILMGMAVALMQRAGLYVRFFQEHGQRVLHIALALVICLFSLREWFSPFQDVTRRDWMGTVVVIFVLSVLYALMVLCGVTDKRLSTGWLGSRPLRFVSKISYALYLAHYAVIPLAVALTQVVANDLNWQGHWLMCGLFLLVFLGAALVLAILMHLSVEKPFLLLRNRIGS